MGVPGCIRATMREIVPFLAVAGRAMTGLPPDFADGNEMVQLHPVDYTNHVGVIAQNDNMVAINSAIEDAVLCHDIENVVPGSGDGGAGLHPGDDAGNRSLLKTLPNTKLSGGMKNEKNA